VKRVELNSTPTPVDRVWALSNPRPTQGWMKPVGQ
jgi:hypothetical protein